MFHVSKLLKADNDEVSVFRRLGLHIAECGIVGVDNPSVIGPEHVLAPLGAILEEKVGPVVVLHCHCCVATHCGHCVGEFIEGDTSGVTGSAVVTQIHVLTLVVGVHELLHTEYHKVALCSAAHSDTACSELVVFDDRSCGSPVRTPKGGEILSEETPFAVIDIVELVSFAGNQTVAVLYDLEISAECTVRSPGGLAVTLCVGIPVERTVGRACRAYGNFSILKGHCRSIGLVAAAETVVSQHAGVVALVRSVSQGDCSR